MRITVEIDDDVLKVAKSLAQTKGLGLGKILSELARKGLAPEPPKGRSELFPTFSCSAAYRGVCSGRSSAKGLDLLRPDWPGRSRTTDPLVTPESIRDALDE